MITNEDYTILDLRYKKKDDCDTEMREAEEKHHKLDKRLVKLETGQVINNWLTAAIAAGIIALVIKVYLGG